MYAYSNHNDMNTNFKYCSEGQQIQEDKFSL